MARGRGAPPRAPAALLHILAPLVAAAAAAAAPVLPAGTAVARGVRDDDGVHVAPVPTNAEYVVHVKAQLALSETAAAAADGSVSSPFATIEAARDHLRVLRASGGGGGHQGRYRVMIGAGTYSPLELQAQDSGSPGLPVVYEADRAHGAAVVSGGVQVPKSAFEPWAGHPGVVKADLAALGLDYGSITAGGGCGGDCTGFAKAGLVFSNLSMVLARWPVSSSRKCASVCATRVSVLWCQTRPCSIFLPAPRRGPRHGAVP